MEQITRLVFYCFVAVMLTACARASLTVQNNSVNTNEAITTISYLPILHTQLAPDQVRIVTEAMSSKWKEINPQLKIATPAQSILQLTHNNKLKVYKDSMELYYSTGAVDDEKISEVCAALNVDALLQGALYGVNQNDASLVDWATTKVTLGYSLISCKHGQIIWSASSDASHKGFWSWSKAVPVYEVMMIAQEAIYPSIPTLHRH